MEHVDRSVLADAVDGWLAGGPLSVDHLAERAVTAGLVPAGIDDDGLEPADHIDWLLERSDAYWSTSPPDGEELVALASTFTETGMTLTHRVTAEELEAEALDELPDLSVLLWEARGGLPLDDGSGTIDIDYSGPATPRITGPAGWIEAVQPGDLLAFTRTAGRASVEIIDADELGDGQAEMDLLADAALRWIGYGRGSEELPVVMEALARDPKLFRSPVPPVGELLTAIGLERRGIEWGWADEEWRTRNEAVGARDTAVRRLFGFEHCCDQAYDRVTEAWRAYGRGEPVDGRSLADDLGHGAVTSAFVHAQADTPTILHRFASTLADTTTGRHAAPALTLLGLAQLRDAAPEAALETLEAALRADPASPTAAGTLALLELDRGDLARAHALASRDGVDPGLLEWIGAERARQAGLRPAAGRNEPCPCGSGRKFKQCCAHGGPLTLDQRVPLILQRLAHHASGPEGHDRLFGLALSAVGRHEDVVDALRRFLGDSFLVDVAIHEGGLGLDYTDQRGPLLADDELTLLGRALHEPRRLWEVTTVERGRSLTLRDTGSGDEVAVTDQQASQGCETGELLFARVVAVSEDAAGEGDGAMFFGVPLLVPLRERARMLRLLDGWIDPDMLASWYGSLSLPPRMTNREGEDLVLRRTVCEVRDDHDDVLTALDRAYERHDDDLVWTEMHIVDGGDRVVRGTLRLDGTTLTVESNSEERQERLLDRLAEVVDHTILEDGEIDLDDGDPLRLADDGDGPTGLDAMPDEVRQLVEQQVREFEDRWVDESIPALAGLTPRQALDDPTRREDLFALLRELRALPTPPGAVGMSIDRLEQLLGITPD